MKRSNKLAEYRRKRDFARTPEPEGERNIAKYAVTKFVIQKHAARRLHYDFRLEVDGVLKSWAVPKGPSIKPQDKRLAVQTEDHPLDYAKFEGIIPKGEYGGGEVIIWDTGTYLNVSTKNKRLIPIQEGLKKGHITVWLNGKKLKGAFSLVKIGEDDKTWLLMKVKDPLLKNYKHQPVEVRPESVVSGKTIEDLKKSA